MRVLLVEDDPMIGTALTEQLSGSAYAVDWVRDGVHALAYHHTGTYDAILLDLGLPGRDGLSVMRDLAASEDPDHPRPPVIVITARGRLDERVRGLDAGADDYLVKPFSFEELEARLRAVLRRGTPQRDARLVHGGLTLDVRTFTARLGDGPPVELTRRDFALLRSLMSRPASVHSRAELEDSIYAEGEEVDSKAIDFLIHRVRAKLGTDVIRNLRGLGWMIRDAR